MRSSRNREMLRRVGAITLALAILAGHADAADDADTSDVTPPVLLIVSPFVVPAGETCTITLRGRHLQSEPEIVLDGSEEPIEVRIINQGSAEIPNKFDAERVGDQFLEVEFAVLEDLTGQLNVSVRTAAGTSELKSLTVLPPDSLVSEQEPNDSLTESQPLQWSQTVRGTIHQSQNVDVFRVPAREGVPLSISATASDRDSLCDPILMIFDSQGQLLGVCDDVEGSLDPSLTIVPNSSGDLLIAIMDTHDLGSQLHSYALRVDVAE